MIRNLWYAILDSREVKKGKITRVKRLGKNLVFFRDENGKVNCIESTCAHRGADLGLGKMVNGHVQCPFHGLEYNGEGKVVLIPANGKNSPVPENFKVKSYKVKEQHGLIWLWWGDDIESLPEVPFVENIDDSFLYDTFIDHWPTHYTRCIENQLDVSHLPFVHYNTIGSGNRTLVNGPKIEVKGKRMKVWVDNQVDDGKTLPIKPEEFKIENAVVHLEFVFPNIWQNYISDKVRVFAAFVPVDEDNTLVYVRFYQKFLRTPLIGTLSTHLSRFFNKIVLHQDRRVVLTQIPKKTELKMKENLFQADLPILEYRKRREQFKQREKSEASKN